MADNPKTNIDGYDLVINQIKSTIRPSASPQSVLAEHLGVSRQYCYRWRDLNGIPREYVPQVSKLTGFSHIEIRPEDTACSLPGSIFDKIAEQARSRKVDFGDHLLTLIKKGLKEHGKR